MARLLTRAWAGAALAVSQSTSIARRSRKAFSAASRRIRSNPSSSASTSSRSEAKPMKSALTWR